MIRVAIFGLGQLEREYPNAPAVPELLNYYRSVLENGTDGSPQISQRLGAPQVTERA
jgi:hypothetical protein